MSNNINEKDQLIVGDLFLRPTGEYFARVEVKGKGGSGEKHVIPADVVNKFVEQYVRDNNAVPVMEKAPV